MACYNCPECNEMPALRACNEIRASCRHPATGKSDPGIRRSASTTDLFFITSVLRRALRSCWLATAAFGHSRSSGWCAINSRNEMDLSAMKKQLLKQYVTNRSKTVPALRWTGACTTFRYSSLSFRPLHCRDVCFITSDLRACSVSFQDIQWCASCP